MPYNEKSKERTMKYLATLKEIRFRVKPGEYERFEQAAEAGDYRSLRQFYLDAINDKADQILGNQISESVSQDHIADEIERVPAEEIP